MREGLRGILQRLHHHEIEVVHLMTVTAYILLNVEMSTRNHVFETIKIMDEIQEVHMIFGAFDIIIKAEFQNNNQLSTFIVDKLKNLEGVLETQTNICAAAV
ncbi:Lrp/AsnC family transcriptional regulator [Candidatus Thorarchaeota archaeon]|nr:MAG: Lrp/AsnC family transcriptional regulator [Candidatus Thorarchaeota archaeon]